MIPHAGGTGAKDDSLRFLLHLDPIQIVHVVAATLWIIGVVRVAIAFRDPTRGTAAARRFRTPAVGLLAVVVLTGYRNALAHFSFGSAWSWALIAKVALVAGAVALGARARRAWPVRAEAGVLGVVAVMGLLLGMNAPIGPSVVVLASAPARPAGACAQTLQGARLAARAVGGAVELFSGRGCGVARDGVAADLDWSAAGRAAGESLQRRGIRGASFVGTSADTTFSEAVRRVLPAGDDAVFVLERAALRSLPASARPVVLAPWLLDARTLAAASEAGLSVLVAAHRDPTDALAVDYRDAAMRTRVTPSAAGFEGFVAYLAAVSGRPPARARAGLYAVATVGVLPADLGHGHTGAGWLPGAPLVRL